MMNMCDSGSFLFVFSYISLFSGWKLEKETETKWNIIKLSKNYALPILPFLAVMLAPQNPYLYSPQPSHILMYVQPEIFQNREKLGEEPTNHPTDKNKQIDKQCYYYYNNYDLCVFSTISASSPSFRCMCVYERVFVCVLVEQVP